ncbi:hypothetical protein Tco_0951111 [Tanacetum coccineum]|uniref:Reverse transcriptase domain-containing protein n=1 Tax=Tanacetum coccineum TaxID=301880 RepID=A0ABQ5DT68_9ASTR
MEGVATELAPSDFVSQNYETLVALMQEETKKRSSQSLQARLNFGPEDEVSPPRHQKERRGKDNRRPPVFGRIGKKVSGTQTANLQNLDTHENNDWRISVRDRLGSRDVHSRLGQRRSPSESPPSSDSEDSQRKRIRRVSSSSEDSSDNEDAETGHWKSKNKYHEDEDEDMSRPWRRQKVPGRQSNDQSGSRNNSYRGQRGGRGNDKYTPLTMTPKEILATEGATFPRPPPMRTPEEQRVGNGYCEYHRQKGHTTNECWVTDIHPDVRLMGGICRHTVRTLLPKAAPEVKSQLKPGHDVVDWHSRCEKIWLMGQLTINALWWQYGSTPQQAGEFLVIRSPSHIQWHYWKTMDLSDYALVHPRHGMLKFPSMWELAPFHTTALPKECNTVTCDVPQTKRQHATKVTNLKVAIHPDYPEQEVSIGGVAVDTGSCEHKLKIRQGYSPLRQKKRGQAPKRAKAILVEVHKLVEADVHKMLPTTEIDWKVEFLRGYSSSASWTIQGVSQIQMARDDGGKDSLLHTSQGVYCYTKMPFGLKNAGATYQRLVDNAFEGQVGRNLEVYVDDLVIKSHTENAVGARTLLNNFQGTAK